jgi:hypothetical protein
MPYLSRPCGRAIPETAVFYPFGHPTPYVYVVQPIDEGTADLRLWILAQEILIPFLHPCLLRLLISLNWCE